MDSVSYSLASKQAQRIKKIIANPDSTSGIVTVPKTITSGETITIPAGRVAVLPNVQIDGVLNIENGGEVFIPSGTTFGDLDQRIDTLDSTTVKKTGGVVTGTTYFNGGDFAILNNTSDSTVNTWHNRIGVRNSAVDRSVFLGTYGTAAVVGSHNNALTAWADICVNTVDGSTGGNVKLPSSTYINGSQVIHAGNYNSYTPTLTGVGASGTWGINITGNAATATTLSTNRNNFRGSTDSNVVGELMWKNYGNNHTIFDASNSTTPTGKAIDNINPNHAWAPTFPTLMGYNGVDTYGVRVDSARVTDSAAKFTTAVGSAPSYACRAWVNFNGTGTVAIRASGNVSSITDNRTGDYTVNFTTAMPDANYGVNGLSSADSVEYGDGGTIMFRIKQSVVPTVSAVRVVNAGGSNSILDCMHGHIAIFR